MTGSNIRFDQIHTRSNKLNVPSMDSLFHFYDKYYSIDDFLELSEKDQFEHEKIWNNIKKEFESLNLPVYNEDLNKVIMTHTI